MRSARGPFAFDGVAGVVDVEVDGPRLSVEIRNTTPWAGETREDALRHALCSTHTLLVGGRFVSATEAGGCENVGTWPVLVGDDAMLSSPIILEDHPRIAPGVARRPLRRRRDRRAAGAEHPRADRRREGRDAGGPAHAGDPRAHREPDRGAAVDAVGIPVGTRVKLRPRAGGDVFDLALAGKTAVVDVVETDMEGRVFVGVLVDDDPGRDLGERGHRFFFSPEEVVPLRVLVAGIGNVFLGDDGFGVRAGGAGRVRGRRRRRLRHPRDGPGVRAGRLRRGRVPRRDAARRRARDAVRDRARPGRAARRVRRARDAPGRRAGAGEDARDASCRGRSCSGASRRRWRSSPGSASRWRAALDEAEKLLEEVLRKETS